ncbi:aminoacyl-tRNA hydrolase [Candidatus Roizmanbacteria bacterium RIFCSPHIGHO2_12_FULL_42_10]|uniref:Peptidyl-tRNA hydrolase n=1 Tax=Candidatus Roizmanbacteria bacterium RIFCSPHIGHO2_12_FULL_42_10 TaxID=1802053 RepID=A0A1F7I3D5_9BACT|nr:MAG: aminoacyl-tRNA hydrolase [Candidatus Roizmanbacteria bacterium RIFCSPHIGHO2_12_FULL_42_10]
MKLFIGLGNPGTEYSRTRHNVGFMFIDFLATHYSAKPFQYNKKLLSQTTETVINDHKIILAKPQTYMNESGRAVFVLINFYKIKQEDIIVFHDDLDIKLGTFTIQKGKGPRVHNGIQSIEKALTSTNFWRGRIGIEHRDGPEKISGKEYVLQMLSDEERARLDFERYISEIEVLFQK